LEKKIINDQGVVASPTPVGPNEKIGALQEKTSEGKKDEEKSSRTNSLIGSDSREGNFGRKEEEEKRKLFSEKSLIEFPAEGTISMQTEEKPLHIAGTSLASFEVILDK
jgi:hypothetical protein